MTLVVGVGVDGEQNEIAPYWPPRASLVRAAVCFRSSVVLSLGDTDVCVKYRSPQERLYPALCAWLERANNASLQAPELWPSQSSPSSSHSSSGKDKASLFDRFDLDVSSVRA